MITRQLRSQFSIFLLFPDADNNKAMKASLFEAGYESFAFIDQETLVSRVKEAAPHVVVFSLDSLTDSLNDFVEQILSQNQEILFICVAPLQQLPVLKEYQEYNFSAVIPEGEYLQDRLVWCLDEVCMGLVRLYQNEKLLQDKKQLQAENAQIQAQIKELEKIQSAPPIEVSFQEKILKFEKVESKDDAIQVLLKEIPCRSIFFKFLPTVNSFVATLSKGVDIEMIKGVGSRLKPDEIENLVVILQSGKLPLALEDLMVNGLKVKTYLAKAVTVFKGLDGILVFWGENIENQMTIDNWFFAFHSKYQLIHMIKRNDLFDIYDPLTELHNKNYYLKKIEEEISRSKRIQKAVSVVRLSIDGYAEMDQKIGKNNRDLILRTLGTIIKKTSRVNDIVARIDENQFGLILVHCARKGAALRAERLRRVIEAHSFGISDLKITVSSGVSEYPSLAASAVDLDQSALKALEFIISRGGNKVCLFRPPESFKPDFEVPSL